MSVLEEPKDLIPWSLLVIVLLFVTGNPAHAEAVAIVLGAAAVVAILLEEDDGVTEEQILEDVDDDSDRGSVDGRLIQLIGPSDHSDYSISIPSTLLDRAEGKYIAVVREGADPTETDRLLNWVSFGRLGGVDLDEHPTVILSEDTGAILEEGQRVSVDVDPVMVPMSRTFDGCEDSIDVGVDVQEESDDVELEDDRDSAVLASRL